MTRRRTVIVSLLAGLAGCPSSTPNNPPADARPDARRDALVDAQGDARVGDGGGGLCGNGHVDGNESCDGADLNGQSCASLGLLFGALGCTQSCRFDFGHCGTCGDGKLQGAEECDGQELKGATCTSKGFTGGTLSCKACQLDTGGCVSSMPGAATVVFGRSNAIVVRSMDTATSAWGAASSLPITGSPRWAVNQVSPVDATDEVAAVTSESAGDLQLHLLHRGASGWALDDTVLLGVPATENVKRVFDLVYEAKSGEALLVYSNNTSSPQLRTFTKAGGWSAAGSALATPPGTAAVRWVVLAARPGTDEIALAYSDSSTHLYNVVWDGSAFVDTSKIKLSDTNGMGHTVQSFDAIYEEKSGDLLVFASDNCCSCHGLGIKLAGQPKIDGGSNDICGSFAFAKLAALRGSDAAAIVGDLASASIWTGAAFYPAENLWPGPAVNVRAWADVAWVGSHPVAVAVHRGWSDASGLGKLFWVRYDGAWQNGAPLPVAGLGEVIWAQLEAFPAEDRVLAVFSDGAKSLWAATYTLAGWKLENGGQPLTSKDLSTTAARAFGVAIGQK
jgi:hypothetical protein